MASTGTDMHAPTPCPYAHHDSCSMGEGLSVRRVRVCSSVRRVFIRAPSAYRLICACPCGQNKQKRVHARSSPGLQTRLVRAPIVIYIPCIKGYTSNIYSMYKSLYIECRLSGPTNTPCPCAHCDLYSMYKSFEHPRTIKLHISNRVPWVCM